MKLGLEAESEIKKVQSQALAEAAAARMRELELRQRLWLRILIVVSTLSGGIGGLAAGSQVGGDAAPFIGLVLGGFLAFAATFAYYTGKRIDGALATLLAVRMARE